MNCGTCTHWNLEQPLGKMGFGTCNARTDPMLRAGIATTPENMCRIQRWKRAEAHVLIERGRAMEVEE